jgi:Rieske Fe-S protein
MADLPDPARRLRLRVTLKLMIALAAAVVATISVRYLAGGGAPAPSSFDVSGMAPQTTRTVGWRDRPVIVLRRAPATIDRLGARLADDPSPAWFVAFANGTARGCTVVWEAAPGRFRESCGEAAWDAAGEPLPGTKAPPLDIPPHRFTGDGRLVLGADSPG